MLSVSFILFKPNWSRPHPDWSRVGVRVWFSAGSEKTFLNQVRSANSGSEKFPLRIPNFQFFTLRSNKYHWVERKNTRVKAGLAPYLLWVRGMVMWGLVKAHGKPIILRKNWKFSKIFFSKTLRATNSFYKAINQLIQIASYFWKYFPPTFLDCVRWFTVIEYKMSDIIISKIYSVFFSGRLVRFRSFQSKWNSICNSSKEKYKSIKYLEFLFSFGLHKH